MVLWSSFLPPFSRRCSEYGRGRYPGSPMEEASSIVTPPAYSCGTAPDSDRLPLWTHTFVSGHRYRVVFSFPWLVYHTWCDNASVWAELVDKRSPIAATMAAGGG